MVGDGGGGGGGVVDGAGAGVVTGGVTGGTGWGVAAARGLAGAATWVGLAEDAGLDVAPAAPQPAASAASSAIPAADRVRVNDISYPCELTIFWNGGRRLLPITRGPTPLWFSMTRR
jgi:hypothetical protein